LSRLWNFNYLIIGEAYYKNIEKGGYFMEKKIIQKLFICGIVCLLFGINNVAGAGGSTQHVTSLPRNTSVSSAPVTTDWWPMLSHDSTRTGYSTSSAPNHNIPLWVSTMPHGTTDSSPVVVDGKLFIGTLDDANADPHPLRGHAINPDFFPVSSFASKQSQSTTSRQGWGVMCLDATTGGQLWYTPVNSSFYTAPAVANGMVYVLCGNENPTNEPIYCLDATTGTEIWSRMVGNPTYSAPIAALGNVYLLVFDLSDLQGKVLCVNGATGATVWTHPLGSDERSMYAVPIVSDTKVYVTTFNEGNSMGHISCLDANTGGVVWSVSEDSFDPATSSPSLSNGTLYVPGFGMHYPDYTIHGMVKWYNAQTGGYIRTYDCGFDMIPYFTGLALAYGNFYMTIYNYDAQLCSLCCVRTTDALKIWEYPLEEYSQSCPAVADGKVFVGLQMGELMAFNALSGDLLWDYVAVYGVYTSIVIAEGSVFFASDGGIVYELGDVSVNIQSITGGVGVHAVVKNQGSNDLANVPWVVTVTGGFVFPKIKSGNITTLSAGAEAPVKFFILGFGRVMITMKISFDDIILASKTANATVLLFFVVGVH
jgi:outer membrane protein assembly factor BamB